ncbi:flagellar M-ring protein FliF [Methylicorpusculum oleiharenae]|uniref:flagellar basal-body MS-ring/collar protein FliF n=1 Tax=Methylicorpusculum oleiharenae TaxID=1338687 RepID=UPI0013586D05|nr:flagellar basal-body MS-ring/collar protein FliF [Methylicorpusculum oleiharenae]MCD2453064.1 flagellar M-ring protein FliF [Methylicorpusculum oleiharenae]
MSEDNGNNTVNAPSLGTGEVNANSQANPLIKGFAGLSMPRQIGLILGFAFSIAISIAVVLWSQETSYSLLFADIAEKDASEIIEVLDKEGIKFKVENGSGAIMVPTADIRELKLKLAALGLPRSTSLGYELLDQEQSFGTSKNVEQIRFQRALEGEIARTIMAIQNVKSARVILALPKQSVFVRKQKKPSASVMVNLYQGRALDKGQIESIIHLVASSVPMMEPGQITVVDQKGRLLNSLASDSDNSLNSKQFEYKKEIEDHLMERIQNILTPLVGTNGFRTQISADVDFTVTEKTQEMFNPDLPALRSEQTREDENSTNSVQGVPGALSNQPPPSGVAPEIATQASDAAPGAEKPSSSSKTATRNFELDKTITHTRLATAQLKRLSVAVVVDDRYISGEDGKPVSQPYSQEEINRFNDLIKQAVGFDTSRGDQVTVSNVAFRAPDEIEDLPAVNLWDEPWFIDLMKQLAAVAVILFLVFAVLRPTMRGLVARTEEEQKAATLAMARAEADAIGGSVAFDDNGVPYAVPAGEENSQHQRALTDETEDLLLLEAPQSYEKRLEYIKKLVDEDPMLVAQIIKVWIKQDG